MTDKPLPTKWVFAGKRALIVDDQELIRTMLHKLLTSLGFKVIDEASDGSDALKKLDRSGYDVIICDVNMSPMGGIEFVQTMRNASNIRFDHKRAQTPVLFLTGSSDMDHIFTAKGLGAKGYLLKPIDPEGLKDRLAKLFTPVPRKAKTV